MATKIELLKQKEDLIEKIITQPLAFTEDEFRMLMHLGTSDEEKPLKAELNFDDLRKMLIRIFDINESTLKEQSDATRGVLGLLNKRSTRKRHKHYYRLIDKGFRSFKDDEKKVIVAEGDSWFQFPIFIKDILDWLSDVPHYAVYSIAYGGDWFTNILYDEKYIEELSIHRPEVFLISGGGNDFVGSNRLAIMVDGSCGCPKRDFKETHERLFDMEADEQALAALKRDINIGYQYILPAFYSFLWTIKAQYWKLFRRLYPIKKPDDKKEGKFDKMKVITQGYDYVIPTDAIRSQKPFALQPLVNRFAGSGKWLKRPLMIQGVQDKEVGCCIMKAMIFEINCLFASLAIDYEFDKVYHIDCRGVAQSSDDWWDEIHLHSEGFEKIAKAYKYCIDNDLKEKVVRVVDV